MWSFIIWYFKDELDKYWGGVTGVVKPNKKFKGKNIIDDVDYQVEKEANKKEEHN